MDILAILKKNAITIMIVIVLLAIGSTVYNQFFSDHAKLIKEYKSQIKEQQDRIDLLMSEYAKLNEEEKHSLDQIAAIKTKLEQMKTDVSNNETTLNEIKNETTDIETALNELEAHTRNSVSRGRDVFEQLSAVPAK